MNTLKSVFFLLIVALFTSCSTQKEPTTQFWVNSYQTTSEDGVSSAFLIQQTDSIIPGQWEILNSGIEDFAFEEGFLYRITVSRSENEGQADSTLTYKLVSVDKKIADHVTDLNGKWMLKHYEGDTLKISLHVLEHAPFMIIDLSKMSIGGMDACNNFMGNIELVSETNIKFGPIALTKKLCPENQVQDIVSELLADIDTWTVKDDLLKLKDNESERFMLFTKEQD
ncbi:MAG: META domain-containing protein [Bacteroidales bacterium]|nr:META domain-containing protein [Bacteroidales bacterium]